MLLTAAAGPSELPAALGVTPRRLNAAFERQFGVTPAAWLETERHLLALRLLGDTVATPDDIALACGHANARALDDALEQHYGASAASLRAARRDVSSASVEIRLPVVGPIAWPRLLGFLAGRCIDGCEQVDGTVYRRTLRATPPGQPVRRGWLEVEADDDIVRLRLADSLLPALPSVLARAWHAFDLGADPQAIVRRLGPLARGEPGLRLPGTFDAFELAVRAILGQQVTVKAARTLASRFVAAFGEALPTPHAGLDRIFPTPATVAGLSVDAIATLGIIGARTRTIIAVATALAEGRLRLVPGAALADTLVALKQLPGIGEWTAQYIAMRALAARDAFPHTDYGVMKALDERNPRRVLALGEQWRPYRAYAVMHLWRSLG